MSAPLPDIEEVLLARLEEAGLGSRTSSPPTLAAGGFHLDSPDACIAVRERGGEEPRWYVGGARLRYHSDTAVVLVRSSRAADSLQAGKARAKAAWEALEDVRHLPGLHQVSALGKPAFLGQDDELRFQWSFEVRVTYPRTAAPSCGA